MSDKEQVIVSSLTDDDLYEVFMCMDRRSLCNAGKVCKRWYNLIIHQDFWKSRRSLNFKSSSMTLELVARKCHEHRRLGELNMLGSQLKTPAHMISSLKNLEMLRIHGENLGGAFFQLLVECPMLSCLSVTHATLESDGSEGIHIQHESLQHLQVVGCLIDKLFVRCHQLKTLCLKHSNVTSVNLNTRT